MQEKNALGIQIFGSNFNVYKKYSIQLFNLLLEYTDVIERFSIDECFLDLTNFLNKNDKLIDKAIEIKERVKKEIILIVKDIKTKNMDINLISEITGLSIDKIRKL